MIQLSPSYGLNNRLDDKMQSEQTVNTMIHVNDGHAYEVVNNLEEIKKLMFDGFIKEDTFLELQFPDGEELHIRKGNIIAFYESD